METDDRNLPVIGGRPNPLLERAISVAEFIAEFVKGGLTAIGGGASFLLPREIGVAISFPGAPAGLPGEIEVELSWRLDALTGGVTAKLMKAADAQLQYTLAQARAFAATLVDHVTTVAASARRSITTAVSSFAVGLKVGIEQASFQVTLVWSPA